MAETRVPCGTCDGQKHRPCPCDRCRSPEGEAFGVMGHYDEECRDCDDEGMVTECCGLPICECDYNSMEAA